MTKERPQIAIIDPNTLSMLGLKLLLQPIVPFADISTFGSMAEFCANHPEHFVHYFAAISIVLENKAFFDKNQCKTIVLTPLTDTDTAFAEYHCLSINTPESLLVKNLLALVQMAHGPKGKMPFNMKNSTAAVLSPREAEVMTLIVKGYINKQIASQLNIALATVVTHRKNIMDKLGVKSVSAMTIYAVMNGYVDINKI